jgi:hypothetical protein
LVFEVAIRVVSVLVVVVLVVGMVSLQVVSLLDVLHLVLNMRVEEVVLLDGKEEWSTIFLSWLSSSSS